MAHLDDKRADHFIEGSTPRLGFTLTDAAGNAITSAMDTLEATIYDEDSETVVPTWTDLDINNANGNVITAGVCVWDLPASGSAKIDDTKDSEDHIIAIKGTYDTNKVVKHMLFVRVIRQKVGG